MTAICYKIDRNGTKYFHNKGICPKCNGYKYINHYQHVEGGICFECGGTGYKLIKWKEYTPEYEAKLNAKRLEKRKALAESNNGFFKRKNNFNEDGYTYIVLGNTCEIKNELKIQGAKFSIQLGWHFNHPESNTVRINIDEVCDKDEAGEYFFKYDADDIVKQLLKNTITESNTSEFVGEVNNKLEVKVTFKQVKQFKTNYSYYGELNYIYTFEDENKNIIVWKTSKEQEFVADSKYIISCKIKAHNIYNDQKQTVVKNLKIM